MKTNITRQTNTSYFYSMNTASYQ